MWYFGSSWRLFPRWLKALTLLVGLPAWLGFAAMIFTGAIFGHQTVTLTLFGVFGFVAVCQMVFMARAAWRNDL
jgi:hypothetical protein